MHEDDERFDLVSVFKEAPETSGAESRTPPDATLGGYMERHDRPVAMEGSDGEAYTVDVEVEELPDGTGFASFLVFVRWAATGGGIMDHRESDDVVVAPTEQAARDTALALPLDDVKTLLDDTIRRRLDDGNGEE